MKAKNSFSLFLDKVCNLWSTESICSGKSRSTVLMTIMAFMFFLSQPSAFANQYPNEFANYMNITVNDFSSVNVHLIALDMDGNNERYNNCVFSYSTDGGFTYQDLIIYDVFDQDMNFATKKYYTYTIYSGSAETKGYLTNLNIAKEGLQIYISFNWYFPASVAGKTLRFKMRGNWIRDYATDNPKSGMWGEEKNISLNTYNPQTSLSIAPYADGNYELTWSGASELSRYELYSDAGFTNLAGTVTGTSPAGSEFVKLGLFNMMNSYYVKQIYTTPSSPAGFSITYEKKFANVISHAGYKYPESVNITPKLNDQKIELGITAGNTSSTQAMKYYIKRDGTLLTPDGFTATNYTDATISPLTDYNYVVYSVPDAWVDKTNVIPELSKAVAATTKPDDITFEKFKLTPFKGTNPYIKVSWDNSEWFPVNTIKLYRKNSTTNDWDDLGIQNNATYYNDLKDIVENQYYTYKFVVDQWGKITSKTDSMIVTDQVAFTKISATKNTFGDRINLQWTIDRLTLCDRFEIYRSFAITEANGTEAWSNEVLVNQFTAQTLVNNWDDRDAAPGMLYKYKIVAIKKTSTTPLHEIKVETSDIGFRMPVGVVTGRITYGAGTAVQSTSVYVSNSSTEAGDDMLYKSLKFSGDAAQGGKVNLTKAKHGCIADKGFTFQAWLKPLNRKPVTSTVFEVDGEYSIRMNNDKILVLMGNTLEQELSYQLDSTIAENSYFHLGVAYSTDKKLRIFVNGAAKDSVVVNKTYTCSFNETTKSTLANNSTELIENRLPFNGNIDDVRLWNRNITNHEAADNYNRYLGGNETGLIAYWPMDEGISTYAFDCSKTDKVYNENHITDIKKASSESMVPKKEQLSIKGVTDANGNYIIRGIPYTGDGSTYSITPVMGTHKFEPKQQLRYISSSSLIHNGTDFVDKSSFPVKVTIKYENTDYPVEGVSFSIDDNPVSKENKLVLTDEKGVANIDVPIGEHYIKASLTGHGFKNNGRYPRVGKIVVDENIRSIDFVDSTLVSVTGRVAGGLVENAKPVGFRKGNANIGPATIILKPALYSNYSLNTDTVASSRTLGADSKGNINSKSTIEKGKSEVIIKTDPGTGEYFVMLPPIKEWEVNSVSIKPNNVPQSLDTKLYNKTILTNPLVTNQDTITIMKNKVDSFKYNVKQNFIYRVDPTINITDVMAKPGAFGDSTYVIQNVNPAKNDTIKLYKTTNGVVNYLLGKSQVGDNVYPNGKPIFTMGELYTFMIEGYEEYFDSTKVSTRVPLSGAAVTVDNEMGQLFRSQAGSPTDAEIPKHEMLLNDKGYVNYQFLVGFPRLTSVENGLSMVVNLNYNNKTYAWKENGKFRGIVMGYEPVAGANFKTRGPGPQIPLVVLRDPPGSNSYAYMEKGTELRYSMSHKHTIEGEFSVQNKLRFGTTVENSIGLGFSVLTTFEAKNDLTVGLSGEYSSFTGTSTENTLTTKERIQTSSSPDFVGSMADVYIGTSTNVYTTDCNFLDIKINENGDTVIYTYTRETSDLQTSTDFRLSQYEILTVQIPMWKKTIRNLFNSTNPDPKTNIYLANKGFDVEQIIKSGGKDTNGNLMYEFQQRNDQCGNQVDSAFIQIKNWQDLIQRNEQTKYNAKSSSSKNVYEKSNISFDAGTNIERSYTFSTSKGDISGDASKTQESIQDEFGYGWNGFGMLITLQEKFGGGRENSSSSTTENSTSFGYVLSDHDTDNRFSVNVYKNKFLSSEVTALETDALNAQKSDETLGSYIFELAAGQTSCPYEGADSTLFYKEKNSLVQLATGSQALDVPKMDVLPVKVKTDVPNGKDANFTLQLESGSTGYSPRQYMLSVDQATNKDGAVILVDGTPLTEPRPYYITKGVPLIKTLTVRQSKLDVLNYENIRLNFSSPCSDITDSKDITVKFVPSCSDLDLVIDSLTMNTETGNSLLLKLKNFNQDYTNFMGMKIQYKLEGEKDWKEKILAKKGVDFGLIKTDSIIPVLKSTMDYRLNFKGKDDGRYQVRAMTICSDPNSSTPINNITPEFIVVKDMVRPSCIGVPSPSNGILTPEEEIAVTFNEPLQINRMVETDFEVEGVLNGATLQHSEGLALDGDSTSQAFTESVISLQNSSFAIEGWVQTADGTTLGNVFSIGEGADKLTLKMNKTSVALYVNDTQVGVTEAITPRSDWQYVSLNYDAYNKETKVFVLNSEENQIKLVNTLSAGINPAGRLMVGSGFSGKIHQVAVWNANRTITDLGDMNYAKSGTENNIVGYWPMDEANGKIAADKVRSRNMIVNSAWFVEPNGLSGVFNGIDNSVVINTATIPLTVTDNFSLEFWFTGKAQSNSTIFSCGKGSGDIKPDEKLSIGFDQAGALSLFTKDVSYAIPNITVLDGNWHHFAMSVSRNGNTNVYVDGQQRLQIPSIKISGLAADKMTIGSRSYYESVLVDNVPDLRFKQDQYFCGKIDEVRIWKAALTSENIRLDMRSKLKSTTSGLIAYYPFEKEVNADGKSVQPSLEDASASHASDGIAANLVYSDLTPGIKMSRQKVKVKFSYIASDNKIVFTIGETMKTIENCILEFTINKVIDMNGNELNSKIKWTAFVKNNRLNWATEQIALTKQVLAAQTFKAAIVNNSGKYENFVIDGLPGWLSVSRSSGRLNPLEKAELTFTVDNSINVGFYECRINLTGNNGIQEMLPVSLKVTGPRPDWAVNPHDYESSMNIVGQIKLDGVYQEDTEDILAAFVGTRCVGIANPKFNKTLNAYMLYMDVYGSSDDTGLPVTFSLWDAGTGRIYPDVDVIGGAIQFVSGGPMLGSIAAPKIFYATDKVEQQLNIKKGWNWISTNVVSTISPVLEQVKSGMATDGLLLKSKSDGYIEYSGGVWDGGLGTLYQSSMYLLKASQPRTLKIVGATAKSNTHPITISPKWNWIGYIPQFVTPVHVALGGLTAKEGDQIKGQVGFATYSEKSWVGSLEYLEPGLGYMYYSTNDTSKTFNYPSQYIPRLNARNYSRSNTNLYWSYVKQEYQSSMTVTAIAKIDNVEIANSNLEIGVFIDDVCRGNIQLLYSPSKNRYFAYNSVWGNATDLNKKITFKCYNPTDGKEMIATNNDLLSYIPDKIVGSTLSPYEIDFSTIVTGNGQKLSDGKAIYPNPVVNKLNFRYDPQDIELFEIVDCTGRTQLYLTDMNKNFVDTGKLVPGVYTLRVIYKGIPYLHRFIKL